MNIKSVVKYVSGSLAAAMLLILTATMVVYPAVEQLVGLAVVGSADGTQWNNVKDIGIQTDGISAGGLTAGIFGYNGTSWDRLRSSVANGLQVDVTRISGTITVVGNQTPSDAFTNPTNAVNVFGLNGLWNGATWDRWKGTVSSGEGGGPNGTLLNSQNSGSVGVALTVTLNGVANTRIHIYQISAGCTGGASSTYVIQDGVTVIDSGIVPANPMLISQVWPTGLTISTASNAVLTVNACGAGNSGILNIQADRY